MPDQRTRLYFELFNEIGILQQLSAALLEARLGDGLLVSHFAVLNHLIRVRDGATPLDLARAFQVPKTTMTHTLAGLERRGFVEMRKNPDDGRSKRVWLTEAGRAFRERAIESLGDDVSALSRAYPPERVEDILPELSDLRKVMDAARDR